MFRNKKHNMFKKILCMTMVVLFSFSAFSPSIMAYAQTLPLNTLNLPPVGSMVPISPVFTPALIKGVTVHPENPLKFNFIVDTGDSDLSETALKKEATRLIKYFLATITVPENELWVNLSPEEKDRIIPESFGVTEMGRDLLAQDYVLKQLTASLLYPEKELGKTFWKRVRSIVKKKYGTDDIPMNSVNKVWIVPEKAVVYENQGSAYVVDSHLKVMMEEEYLASSEKGLAESENLNTKPSTLTSKIIKEIIVPEIEKEVNQGESFARLRQVYNSMILASWYKDALKESLLVKVYADRKMIKGVDVKDKQVKQKIYDQYMEAFKEGVYNYIREDFDETTGEIVLRKYVSGGAAMKITPIEKVIKGAPDQLTAEDFSIVTKGLNLNSKKSRLMNFDVTVVENLTDAQSQELIKFLKSTTTVSTKSVDFQNSEDAAMTVAPQKELANHIQTLMTSANEQSREFNAEQQEKIGLTNKMVTAINQDVSIPLFVTVSERGTITAEQLPNLADTVKAQAEAQKTQFKESLTELKNLVKELSQFNNDGDYLKAYKNFNPIYNRVRNAIFDIKTNFKTDVLFSSKKEKVTRIQTLVNNTLKHYLANKLVIPDIAPNAIIHKSLLKKFFAFKITLDNLAALESVFDILLNLKELPSLIPNNPIFNLEAEIAKRSTSITEKVSSTIIETMAMLHLNEFEIYPNDAKILNLNNDRIAAINNDVSIPLWIKGQDGETLKVKYLPDMPKLLRKEAEDKLLIFIGIFSTLKIQFKNLITAKTERDYEFAFGGIEESVNAISKYLNGPQLFVRPEDVVTISSASTKVKRAQQMISNTIRHFISNKITPVVIVDPFMTPFKDSAKRTRNLRTGQRSIDAVDAIINVLLHLQEVPKAQGGNDGVYAIEGMIKARMPEDYAMTSQTKIASAIFDLAESGQDRVMLSPQKVAELGITAQDITELNQNLSLGLWLSGSVEDGITADTKLFIAPEFKIIARKNLDQISSQYFGLYHELKTMVETHSQKEYRRAYEHIATLINIINAKLSDMETSLKDMSAPSNLDEKINRIYAVFKNSIKYYAENRLHPEFINPKNLPFNSTRAEKKAAIAQFNLGLIDLGIIFHKVLNITSIPAFIDSLEIFDLQQTLGLNSRKPKIRQEDNAMISYELKQLALMQSVFDFNYNMFLAYNTGQLDELKSELQHAQARLDLIEFYKILKRLRVYLKRSIPENLMAPYLNYKIQNILDFAEENQIRLPDGLNFFKDDVAMLTQAQINEANRREIFDFEYPETLEEKTDFLSRYLESDFFNARMQYDLISYYRSLILLRDQVGQTLGGQPYSYLTQKINAVILFAHDKNIALPNEQTILPRLKQEDLTMVSQTVVDKADAEGLFDFTYPRISGAEKDSAIKIKAHVFHAQAKKDFIGYYTYIVALRKAVGATKYKGRPYRYLTKKIKAIEAFAQANELTLPPKTDVQVADYAMVADIEDASILLGVDSSVIYLALMLGYNELPNDLSQYYGIILNAEEIQTLDLKEVDADIFIKTIAGESARPVSEENIVNLLEATGLFATLTDQWRDQQIESKEKIRTGDTDFWGIPAYQTSIPIKPLPSGGFLIVSDDEAMTEKEEAPKVALALGIDQKDVELALGLAAYGIPYELTLEMGMPALEILKNKTIKKIDPYLFIENLIKAANLNLSFGEIVKRLEDENIFNLLTQKIRADEIENQQILSLDIPSAAQTLKMNQNKIKLALKLATIGMSDSLYLDHSVILEDVDLAGMRVIFAEPSIFIDALIKEGNLPITAEAVVEKLEKAGSFSRLTEEWRAEQASFEQAIKDESAGSWSIDTEDEAMTVKAYTPIIAKTLEVEEDQVKMALGLAAFNIPYKLALTYGNVPLDKFDNLPIEKINPYVFMENLIEIAHLKLTTADIVDRLENANVLPDMTETYRKDEKENEKMITVDMPLAVNALAIDQKAIELALKLASVEMPYSIYLEYGAEINENLSTMHPVLGDPFIFIETLLGISNMEMNPEQLVEILEQNNLFTRLTKNWRKAQNSLRQSLEQGKVDSHGIPMWDDYAISVESNVRTLAEKLEIDEKTVELAVLLAYKGIPYSVYVDHGPVIEETLENVDLEEADPGIFLETLITEADLDMTEEALITLMEKENLFYEITENFLAHQQAVEDALNAGLTDSWGMPLLGNATDEATSEEDIEEGPGYYVGGWTYQNVLNHIYPELLALADTRQTTPIALLTQLRDDFQSGKITEDDHTDETFKILKFNLHGTGEWDAEDIETILSITQSVVYNVTKQNAQAEEDNAVASSPQRIAFDIERSLARLQNLHLDKNRIETQKPLNGIIELQLDGQIQYKTPEGWSEYFQMKIEDEKKRLTRLKERQKEQEQNSPTNADRDIPEIINAFKKGLFAGQEESLLDLNLEYNLDLTQYSYIDNPSNAYAELKSLGHLAPLSKTNLFIFGEKSRFSFVEIWNILSVYHNISLHLLTYADGTKNIIVHFNFLEQKQEDTAMTTSSAMISYQIEKTLKALAELNATRKRVMATKTEDGLILLNVGQVLLKTPKAWGEFFQRSIKAKQDELFRLLKKEKEIEKIAPTQADAEMDSIKSLFLQKYFSKRMEEALSENQKRHEFVKGDTNIIYNRLIELSKKLYAAKTNLFIQGERQKITFFDALSGRYKFETLHIIEYTDGSINAVLVRKEKTPKDMAMTTVPSFLNLKIEQTFEQLNELINKRAKMMSRQDQKEVIMRNFGQMRYNTPEGWANFYKERIDSERKMYQALITKRDQQEQEEPTNADLDISKMESLLASDRALDKPLNGTELSPAVIDHSLIQGTSAVFLKLRELRYSLIRQKVNLFTKGYRTNFTDLFNMVPLESTEIYLHVITYEDGSINVIYWTGEPKGEDDNAIVAQKSVDQKILDKRETGEMLIESLADDQITTARLDGILEFPYFIDSGEARNFLPRDWKGMLSRFGSNVSENLSHDFGQERMDLALKWNDQSNLTIRANKAIFLIFDSTTPVLQRGAEVIISKNNLFKMIRALVTNGRRKEALRLINYLERKKKTENQNLTTEDLAMPTTPTIEKPRVLVVMNDPQKTNELYLKLNQTGGLFVHFSTNNTEALQLITHGVIPTIVLTDNQNLITELEKNYPNVSIFTYTEKGQRLKGNNILFEFSQNSVPEDKLGSKILQTLWRVNDTNSEYGGIDFTRSRLKLEIRRDAKGVPLPINDQPLENMNIEGFFPVIINVTPIQNLPLMIGISEKTDLLARKK